MSSNPAGMTFSEANRKDDLQDKLLKQGLPWDEISRRLAAFDEELHQRNVDQGLITDIPKPSAWLMPGGSLSTPAWAFWSAEDQKAGKKRPKATGPFTDLAEFVSHPGKYRIKAKLYGTQTKFIPFEVTP